MDIEKKLTVLARVAKELNANEIIWAAGGSFLLFTKGIVDVFNDIDVMLSENDVEKVKILLKKYGEIQSGMASARFRSKAFFGCTIDGVDFDFIAGFTIVKDGTEYYFPLNQKNIRDVTYIKNVAIPLQSVGEWKVYYSLMGKVNKVELIDESLNI